MPCLLIEVLIEQTLLDLQETVIKFKKENAQLTELSGLNMPAFLTFEVIGKGKEFVQVIDFEKEMQTID